MDDWSDKLKEKLEQVMIKTEMDDLNLEPDINKVYVDDNTTVCEETPVGAVYNKRSRKVVHSEKQAEKDRKIGADERTAELVTNIANTIDPSIVMKWDAGSKHEELGFKLPVLDTAVWMEDVGDTQEIRLLREGGGGQGHDSGGLSHAREDEEIFECSGWT